ncbi:polyamine ABC transporter substrate-binding protein [Motiliproteus sp.]|uniref:polyamine ABC transporter substrate-binding protein n=1 Tax=Motiliproteus sp. TaxID=1898955 RepID=UPI003BAD02AF
MKKLLKQAFPILTLSTLVAANSALADGELKIFNWSDYIAEDTIEKFEQETGIKVTYDVFDSNETLEARLLAGNSGFDLVVPSSNFLGRQIKAGVFEPLDSSKLPNRKHMDPILMAQLETVDPGNKHALPYMWGTTGLGYNPAKVAEVLGTVAPVDSWSLIFDLENLKKLQSCGVTLLDSADEVLPIALQYLGKDPNSKNPADYKSNSELAKLLKSVAPYIKQYHSSSYIADLANGETCVAMGWSGDVIQAAARAEEAETGQEVLYSIPKEGTNIWFDMMAIPADAKNKDNAHRFIDYVMRPQVIADITNYVWYANPNPESMPLLDEELRNDETVFPNKETMNNLFISEITPLKIERLKTRLWTSIKTGR